MSNYEFWNELGKIFNAVVAYQEKSIEFNKRFINPWIRIGNVFDKQDQYREAVHSYQYAIEIDPGNAQNWLELGNAHFAHQAYDEAMEAFRKAIELDANQGWPYSNLAFIYAIQGRYVEAKALYEKSIPLLKENREKAISWNRLGNLHRKLNEYDLAILAFQKADELDHENGGFRDELDEAFKQSQHRKEPDVSQAAPIPTSIQLIVEQCQAEEESTDVLSDPRVEISPAIEIVEADSNTMAIQPMMEAAVSDEAPSQTPSLEPQTTLDAAAEINPNVADQTVFVPVAEEISAELTSAEHVTASGMLELMQQPAIETAVPDESLNVVAAQEAVETSSKTSIPDALLVEHEVTAAPVIAEVMTNEAIENADMLVDVQPDTHQPDVMEPLAFAALEEPSIDVSVTEAVALENPVVETAAAETMEMPLFEETVAQENPVVETSAIETVEMPAVEVKAAEAVAQENQVAETAAAETVEEPFIDVTVTEAVAQVNPVVETAATEAVEIPAVEANVAETVAQESRIEVESAEFVETRFEVEIEAAASSETAAPAPVMEMAGNISGESSGQTKGMEHFYDEFLADDARERALKTHIPEPSQAVLPEPPAESMHSVVTMIDESGEVQIEMDTKNAHIWNELGNVYFNRGAIEDAIVAYSKAIELDRWFAWPYSNLALAYVQKARFAEAMLLYQRSIELFTEDKDKAISWNRLGNVYRRLNDYDNAIAAYQRADELDPGNNAIYQQSRFSLLGNFKAEPASV